MNESLDDWEVSAAVDELEVPDFISLWAEHDEYANLGVPPKRKKKKVERSIRESSRIPKAVKVEENEESGIVIPNMQLGPIKLSGRLFDDKLSASHLIKYTSVEKSVFDFIYERRSQLPHELDEVSTLTTEFRESIGLTSGKGYKLSVKKLVFIYYKYCIIPLENTTASEEAPCYETIRRISNIPIIRLSHSQVRRLSAEKDSSPSSRQYIL